MNKTIKCIVEANFTIEHYPPDNKKYLRISILELIPEHLMYLSSITNLKEEIELWDIEQEYLSNLNIDSLDEEKEYIGKFNVELHYWSTYDNWTGAKEYDATLSLNCQEYREDESVIFSGLEINREYSKIFRAVGNKGGDFIFMKLLPSGKIQLKFAHCCVSHKDCFVDVTTITACLTQHLHEYREKKQ